MDRNFVKAEILRILQRQDSVTRPDLTERFGIRPATLFEIIDSLKEQGILAEPERKGRKTGRKASPICLNAAYGSIIGLDFQNSQTSGVVMDMQGRIIARESVMSSGAKDAGAGLDEIKSLVAALKKGLRPDCSEIIGMGFADPGLVDIERGFSVKAVNIDGWEGLDTAAWIKESFGLDSVVYPAPIARTFIESMQMGPDFDGGLFHMELSTGIGGGFIKNDVLFEGDSNCGMEIGHILVAPNGPLCQCGNRGCLEAVAGEAGIKRKVCELLDNGVQTILSAEDFSIGAFIESVGANDKAASALAHEICGNIGMGLAAIVAILNPAAIVLSGELSGLGELLTSSVERTLALHCFPSALKNLRIKVSELDSFANAVGAALLMRGKILDRFTY